MIWKTRKGQKGFTLVELMIVVAIIGVLATLAVYGVRRYIANAKSAEARATVGQIGKLAAAAYERESGTTSVVTIGEASATNRNLCAAASAVPTSLDSVRNKKYQSQITDWSGSQTAGWRCLRFTMDGPQYYQYKYTLPSDSTFKASAHGDLDGNSKESEFSLAGSVIEGQVRLAPTIAETDPEE